MVLLQKTNKLNKCSSGFKNKFNQYMITKNTLNKENTFVFV